MRKKCVLHLNALSLLEKNCQKSNTVKNFLHLSFLILHSSQPILSGFHYCQFHMYFSAIFFLFMYIQAPQHLLRILACNQTGFLPQTLRRKICAIARGSVECLQRDLTKQTIDTYFECLSSGVISSVCFLVVTQGRVSLKLSLN